MMRNAEFVIEREVIMQLDSVFGGGMLMTISLLPGLMFLQKFCKTLTKFIGSSIHNRECS